MERKIGEIFELHNEWYQCIKSDNTCNGCVGRFQSYSFCNGFEECAGKIFKKLEKVGEPYSCNYYGDNRLIMMQEYNLFNLDDVTNEDKIPMYIIDYKHKRIAIEIKETKEDMEENKLNLKPFDIQKAREGKPVCTRDGRKVRIICFDRRINRPIIALIEGDNHEEALQSYFDNGRCCCDVTSGYDLMMLPEKKEGWVNVYKHNLYDTESEAKRAHVKEGYIDTIKIEWEE